MTIVVSIVAVIIFGLGLACGAGLYHFALRTGIKVGTAISHDEEVILDGEERSIEQETTA